MTRRIIRGLVACALLLIGGAGNARQPTRATDTEVTLVFYSGRVDPVWVLNPGQATEFRQRLEHLPRAPEPYASPVKLGFLRVLLPDGRRRRQEVILDHGRVIWADRKVLWSLIDKDRALEAWLLATGKGRTSEGERWFTIHDLDRAL